MQVKIDTKEKFHVITILDPKITANMTAEMEKSLSAFLQKEVKNVVLNLNSVTEFEVGPAETLVKVQQSF